MNKKRKAEGGEGSYRCFRGFGSDSSTALMNPDLGHLPGIQGVLTATYTVQPIIPDPEQGENYRIVCVTKKDQLFMTSWLNKELIVTKTAGCHSVTVSLSVSFPSPFDLITFTCLLLSH